jgi:hypothetical protein
MEKEKLVLNGLLIRVRDLNVETLRCLAESL